VGTVLQDFIRYASDAGADPKRLVIHAVELYQRKQETGDDYPTLLQQNRDLTAMCRPLRIRSRRTPGLLRPRRRSGTEPSRLPASRKPGSPSTKPTKRTHPGRREILEVNRLATMIRNAEPFDYDMSRIVSQLKSLDGLLDRKAQLETPAPRPSPGAAEARGEAASLKQEVQDLQMLKATLTTHADQLTKLGVDAAEQMKAILKNRGRSSNPTGPQPRRRSQTSGRNAIKPSKR